MAVIHLTPEEIRNFAHWLNQFNQNLAAQVTDLNHQYARLGESWRDPAYAQFAGDLADATQTLEHFSQAVDQMRQSLLALAERADQVHGGTVYSAALLAGARSAPPPTASAVARVRYQTHQDIAAAIRAGSENITQSSEGQRLCRYLPAQMGLTGLIRVDRRARIFQAGGPSRDVLGYVSGVAQQAGADEQATGRLVHRIAELRTLAHYPNDILRGIRQTEQYIAYQDETGANHHIEIDTVIVRGSRHFVRDYKPINLRDFEQIPAGHAWAQWAREQVGSDYGQRIQMGENPYFGQTMPADIRRGLQQFLTGAARKHRDQLSRYHRLYAAARNIPEQQVSSSVRPYFVYRDRE